MLNYLVKYFFSFNYDVNIVICYKIKMVSIQKQIIKHYNDYKIYEASQIIFLDQL